MLSSIDSILQTLTEWVTLPISDGKHVWMSQIHKKPELNTKCWATDLWASGSSFVIPFRMPHELKKQREAQVSGKLHLLALIEIFKFLFSLKKPNQTNRKKPRT